MENNIMDENLANAYRFCFPGSDPFGDDASIKESLERFFDLVNRFLVGHPDMDKERRSHLEEAQALILKVI
jgi:hypothetical protein